MVTVPSSILSKEQKLQLLKNNEGGTVDLEINKYEGIAVITLNYAQKKNALSG